MVVVVVGEGAVVREVSESLGANQAVGSSGAGINNETPATLSSDCAIDLRAHVFTRLVGADVKGKAEVLGSTMVLRRPLRLSMMPKFLEDGS